MAASKSKRRPQASSPEIQETRMVNYAMQLAEKQLIEGTASPSVITHFLKIGSMRERKELERLENENKLLAARADIIESTKRSEELFVEAMKVFSLYNGTSRQNDEEDDDDY